MATFVWVREIGSLPGARFRQAKRLCVPKWRNWQTRYIQGVVPVREWRFESSLRHQDGDSRPSIGPLRRGISPCSPFLLSCNREARETLRALRVTNDRFLLSARRSFLLATH